MIKFVDNLIKYGHVYSAVALNQSSPQVQEAQNNQVYAGLIENVTGAPVNIIICIITGHSLFVQFNLPLSMASGDQGL